MIRATIAAAAFMLCAPAAFAECGDERLQLIANRFQALAADPTMDAKPVAAALKADVAQCQADPFALKLASITFANMAARQGITVEQALDYASNAFAAYAQQQTVMPTDNSIRYIITSGNVRTPVNLNDNHQIGKAVVDLLLQAEALAGRAAQHNQPPKPGDPKIKCDVYQTSMAQHATFWVNAKQDSPGAMNIVDRIIANCTGNDHNVMVAKAYRAKATLSMLKRTPARPDATALITRALDDAQPWFSGVRKPDGYWTNSDQADLSRLAWGLIATQGKAVPADQWFTPANVNKPLTNMSIAAALDEAWAKDYQPPVATPNTWTNYRNFFTPTYNRARSLPEPQQRQARMSLYVAAKAHAEGVWRRDANKALMAPPIYLWSWADPDYKPPASNTPAAPATPKPN